MTADPPPAPAPPPDLRGPTSGPTPLEACARRTERFVAAAGWDQPPRLFALVETARLLAAEPQLADTLTPQELVESSDTQAGQLSSIEQDGWIGPGGRTGEATFVDSDGPDRRDQPAPSGTVSDLLAALAWPPEVDGAALAIERVVAPHGPRDPAVVPPPDQPDPDSVQVRLFVAVLRDGTGTCLLRQRAHDADELVASGPEIAPTLLRDLAGTLRAD